MQKNSQKYILRIQSASYQVFDINKKTNLETGVLPFNFASPNKTIQKNRG